VVVTGGTHVPHAPAAEYVGHVYGATLAKLGLEMEFQSESAGFFPRGGGKIRAAITPTSGLQPMDMETRGAPRALTAYIVTSELKPEVAERGEAALRKALQGMPKLKVVATDLPSRGPGAAVVLVAECSQAIAGFSAVGERGKRMETVAEEACAAFRAWWKSNAGCDEHLADQLVLPMALVPQTSRWTTSLVTEHLRTVLWVVKQFLPVEAALEERADGSGLVTMTGVALA
jgi:RNA 3'-terminal phosphate cyclase (ATP)